MKVHYRRVYTMVMTRLGTLGISTFTAVRETTDSDAHDQPTVTRKRSIGGGDSQAGISLQAVPSLSRRLRRSSGANSIYAFEPSVLIDDRHACLVEVRHASIRRCSRKRNSCMLVPAGILRPMALFYSRQTKQTRALSLEQRAYYPASQLAIFTTTIE